MKTGPKPKSAEERFWSRVQKQEGGCWLYNGPDFGNKYGQLSRTNDRRYPKMVSAHRFSYEIHNGPIKDGGVICHKCDVKNCVNPDHLYCGTQQDNVRDIVERGRSANKTGRVVRLVDAAKRYRGGIKLRRELQERVKSEYQSGKFTQVELAKRYRCSQATISATIRGAKNQSNGTGGKKRSGHFRRKVQPEQYQEIRDLYATGQFTQNALAERFGIDQTTVSAIINFKLRGMKP